MFKILFDIILDLLASIVQLIMWPLNQVIVVAFPNISDRVVETSNNLANMFDGMAWAIGLIPEPVRLILITILGIEIAKHSIYFTTHVIVKLWNVVQKLKFW